MHVSCDYFAISMSHVKYKKYVMLLVYILPGVLGSHWQCNAFCVGNISNIFLMDKNIIFIKDVCIIIKTEPQMFLIFIKKRYR